jgi:hypothetical protein
MAKASDLIGKSGAGGLGPIPKPAFSKPLAEGEKDASKAGQPPKKDVKSRKAPKGKGGRSGGSTTSPSVRPKV